MKTCAHKWLITALIGFGALLVQANSISPIQLQEGPTDLAVKDIKLRIIKGQVSLLSAHNFETYHVFIVPNDKLGSWLDVPFDNKNEGPDYFANSTESADSNIQSIRFFTKDDQLFAVRARKVGANAPDLNLKKTTVSLRIFRFNEDTDIPSFVEIASRNSKHQYLDAYEAITQEVFTE